MWPMLLDMSKLECKKSLRALELEAYASVVTAFRAQGDLTVKKIEILKELQSEFKISIDRHKAELRRANNDEKLYTIARRLSHGECISSEWIKQSKRLIPLLPRLEANDYYRILADHIVSKTRPILNMYPETCDTLATKANESSLSKNLDKGAVLGNEKIENTRSKKLKKKSLKQEKLNDHESNTDFDVLDNQLRPLEDEKNIVYLANGYAVDSSDITVQSIKPSEYVKKHLHQSTEADDENSNSLIKTLLQKYNQQQMEKENLKNETFSQVESTITLAIPTDANISRGENEAAVLATNYSKKPTALNLINTSIAHNNQQENNLNPIAQVQQQTVQIQARPPTTLKVSSAQMIKLTPTTSPLISSIPILSCTNTPTNLSNTTINNQPTFHHQTSIGNSYSLSGGGTSTIVKLTPTQINFNTMPNCIQKNTIVNTSNATNSILNNQQQQHQQPQQQQQLKHYVVPKTNQKLIILPSHNDANMNNSNNLNGLSIKQNLIVNNANNTTSKNGFIQSNNSNQVNNESATTIQKVYMYKQTGKTDEQMTSIGLVNENQQTIKGTPMLNTQSLKILSGPPTVMSLQTPTSLQLNNKHIFLNVPNSTLKNSSNNSPFKITSSQIQENHQSNFYNHQNIINLATMSTTANVYSTLNGHVINEASKDQIFIGENNDSLKRKHNQIDEENQKSPASSSTSSKSSTISASPPNWCETNLQFIKEMLSKLKSNNENDKDSDTKIDNQTTVLRQRADTIESNHGLRVICETIKEKLEKNAYECVEDLNSDLNSIKEKIKNDCLTIVDQTNNIDNCSNANKSQCLTTSQGDQENENNGSDVANGSMKSKRIKLNDLNGNNSLDSLTDVISGSNKDILNTSNDTNNEDQTKLVTQQPAATAATTANVAVV